MDGPGFHVDIEALERAGDGIAQSIADQKKAGLKDVCADADSYGDEALHSALRRFCDRWNDGMDLLIDDAQKISDILARAGRAYRAVENATASRLRDDPGAQVIGD
ncbi:hypothetical protein [Actinoplanes sp. N902-109]|uniref:hypothetical protein n=1 Tax=Actinoplanes sp. (strain N902-109) TaxID=649831 RepID=UPI000329502C|nr:hypothetical protein [Actinoplanes sp. N902-109]AGL14301.1 hypothetical protein L083_0791 [Actinoplanes sp. N902-109]